MLKSSSSSSWFSSLLLVLVLALLLLRVIELHLALQFPAFFCGLASVTFSYLSTFALVRRHSISSHRDYFGIAFGFCAGLWMVYQPANIQFAGLMSLVWFYTYFLSQRSWNFKNFVSLLFLVSHYFALPLVLGVHALEFFSEVRSGEKKAARRRLLWSVGMVLFAVGVHYRSFPDFSLSGGVQGSFQGGLKVWLESMEYLALPYTAFLFIADLFFAAIKRREARLWHLIWVSMIILPVFYISFPIRAFLPNLGLGLVLLQLGFVSAVEALVQLPVQRWISAGVVGVAVFFTISFSSLTNFSMHVFSDAGAVIHAARVFRP